MISSSGFPSVRLRRLRKNKTLRRMVRESYLSIDDLIYPLFIIEGKGIKNPINSLPECYQISPDMLKEEIEEILSLDIPAVLLFGIPRDKDEIGSSAYDANGVVQDAVKIIKEIAPDLMVITDVCVCEYTSHGHCGIIKNGDVDNDTTLELLSKMALSHVKAGADMVAPSDMMDGRIGKIRETLDKAGFSNIPIMSYAAKYASFFYGPFREAADSAPKFGDRRSYQMAPPNFREAIREMELDALEGADILMVKPALPYLDIISKARELFLQPIAAYNVSGEYSIIKAAGKLGWIDEKGMIMESLMSIKRAGADLIITYFAKEAAKIIKRGELPW